MIVKPTPAPADPSKVCKTCGHYYPNLEVCAADDSFVTEADSKVRSCNDWEPRKEKLSVFSVRETIGMTPVNPAEGTPEAYGPVITECRTGDHRCRNCAYCNPDTNHCTVRSRVMSSPSTTVCMQWAPKQTQMVFGCTSLKELEEKQKAALVQKCLIAKEKGYRRGYMIAELHMMCDAASQLLPDRKPQWERLRNILEDALRALWARNDQDKKESKA